MVLRIGTSEYGGTFYTQGAAFAELFNRDRAARDQCVIQTSDASIHNAEQLDRGELEFGFMASNWIGRAKDATAPFKSKIALRMVAPANAGPMCFVRLADSPIRSVADFSGKRIAVGAKGSGMEQHIHTIFSVLGISFDSFTPVHMSFAEGTDALVAGAIDVQFHPPIPNKVLTELSERADVRFTGLPNFAPEILRRVALKDPTKTKQLRKALDDMAEEAEHPEIAKEPEQGARDAPVTRARCQDGRQQKQRPGNRRNFDRNDPIRHFERDRQHEQVQRHAHQQIDAAGRAR